MDMPMASNSAVANLPLSDPDCINALDACNAYYAAANQSQADISWSYQFEYGHWATYYYVIIIGLLFFAYVFVLIKDRFTKGFPTNTSPHPSILQKLQALWRFIFYRRIRASWPAKFLDAPTDYGTMLFLLITIVFFTALVFAVKPYYRAQIGFGSPPIAIRSGLMAFACCPILVALSGKANVITFFTGISHERLNVLHRWVAWISFALALFHSLPFFVGGVRNAIVGGEAQVIEQFYMYGKTGANEYTGVPPLAILFGLCVLSLPYIRHRFYESFYAVHILLAITYLGLLFWHSGDVMDSWAYLWATLAIWGTSWLIRAFVKTQPLNVRNPWLSGEMATLRVVSGDVTRVDVWCSNEFHWKPSQHVFLRFVDISPMENHPFTISNAQPVNGDSPPHLVFLPRAHTGFTRKLLSYVSAHNSTGEKSVTTSVWFDGPYGGPHRPLHKLYDTLILVAGGTGITTCLPWLQDAVARTRAQDPSIRIKRVVLVWAMKRIDSVEWLAEEFDSLARDSKQVANNLTLELRLHVTGGEAVTDPEKRVLQSKPSYDEARKAGQPIVDVATSEDNPSSPLPLTHITALGATLHTGRPNMFTVLQDFVHSGECAMVIGCGPNTFNADLGNAVAAAQSRVLNGDVVELAMKLETFGW